MESIQISRNIGSQIVKPATFRRHLQNQGLKKDLRKGSGVDSDGPKSGNL